ncbi:hypothetical protein GCM10028801_14110 [Nocardioides maradonensis]
MSRRTLVTLVLSVAAVALLAAGWLLPQVLLYLAGVVAAAVLIGLVLRRRRAVLAGVVVVAVGVGLPFVVGRGDAGDPAWRTSLTGQTVVRAGGVFIAADDSRVHLLTLDGGRELWSVPGWGPVVDGEGDLLTLDDGAGNVARYDRAGQVRWRRPAATVVPGRLRAVAMSAATTVLSSCSSGETWASGRCTLVGVGTHGRILWRRVWSEATIPVPHQLLPTTTGQSSTQVAVRIRRGGSSVLTALDPATGAPLVTVPMPPAYATGLVMTTGDRLVAAEPGCGLAVFADGVLLGRRRNPAGCRGPIIPDSVLSAPMDRFYLRTTLGGPVTTFDIDLGAGRVLAPDEYADADGPEVFGTSVVLAERVSGSRRELVATDAESGRVVWRRALDPDATSAGDARFLAGVWNGVGAVVVRELSHAHNPYLRPHLQLGDGRFSPFADRSRRFALLDAGTGRERAAVLDGSAGGADVRVVAGDGYAVVGTPDGTYRVG